MFLKSLTLKGFKSFADATTLEFEPGITVVVGPNGSGKSNIVDAVAWVLGAQGPRTVRSAKMEDVIFAGTPKRPALGRAEVTLTIDNSSGLLPIEFAEVTISRTLWRSGESEYALNGVPCRLLDLQELLSDSGVGRQQHVIVSQGQLDAVLNAQPTDRRLIIEEAAGVLKYRRRREKAQRRLDATEGNLMRVQDLLREVRRQLRPLERQAEAARRHGDVVTELAAIRRYLAGREVNGLRTRAETVARVRGEVRDAESNLVAALSRLDAGVIAAEAALSAAGDSGLGDVLGRMEGARERARGLIAVLAERRRTIARLRTATLDQELVATLEAEAASLATELAGVDAEARRLAPEAAELAASEHDLADELAAFEADWSPASAESDGPGVAAAPVAGEVRGELAALRSTTERARADLVRHQGRLESLSTKAERVTGELDRLRAEQTVASDRHTELTGQLDAARAACAAAADVVGDTTNKWQEAEAERVAWRARVDALVQALDEARARAGAQRLEGLDGLVGTLLDVVDVDPGWEAAFEAALGEAISSVVVDGVGAARQALTRLATSGGAVLALSTSEAGTLSPSALSPSAALSVAAEPVRWHVRASLPAVEALLDQLLAGAVVVDGSWEAALDVVLANPALVVVTRAGDRFAPGGWRTGTGTVGATGAALEEARARATACEVRASATAALLDQRRSDADAARAAEEEAATALEQHRAVVRSLADAVHRASSDARDIATEREGLTAQVRDLETQLVRDDERVAELEQLLPALEAEEAAGIERAVAMRAVRSRLDQRQAALNALRRDLEVRAGGLDERRSLLTRRQADVETRLERHRSERELAQQRRIEMEQHDVALERLATITAAASLRIEQRVGSLREERRVQAERVRAMSERLDVLRRERAAAERELGVLRERAQRAELDDAEIRLRLENATESIRREFDCEPDGVIAAECPELPPGTTPDHRARELERDLRLMGPINPLALEEYAALQERHEFLESQLEDVKSGRKELAKIIRAIDTEIVEVFSAAYADVSDNFSKLFATLFPGGTGRLRLTDPDNLLETGIEVEARPSGKNVKRLSLLSGGERSLTAMAFLFAVFRSRPSPFYLMDEVEAALDDVNLHRFLDLIREFRDEAQLLIVSHQKRTMEAADCLYGVTMQPAGSSRVVSERVAAGA